MEMKKIISSNIESIGYKENISVNEEITTNGTLRIIFKHGGTYNYLKVPITVWKEFSVAKSKGSHFYRKILNKYHTKKI